MTEAHNFNAFLQSLDALVSSERCPKLARFAKAKASDSWWRAEVDRFFAESKLAPGDYALVVQASQSLPWAVSILRDSSRRVAIKAALDVVRSMWKTDSRAVQNAFGGDQGICEVLNNLPRFAVVTVFSMISRGSLSLEVMETADTIMRAIYPFLSQSGSQTPLSRYARPASQSLFMAASPDVVLSFTRRCSTWISEDCWTRFASVRPQLMGSILLEQVRATNGFDFKVDPPSHLAHTLEEIVRHEKDSSYFMKFVANYTTGVLKDPRSDKLDYLGASRGTRVAKLAPLMSFILRNRTPDVKVLPVALQFCDVLHEQKAGGAVDEWKWNDIKPLLDIAVTVYSRSPGLWTADLEQDGMEASTSPTATDFLLQLFKGLQHPMGGLLKPDPLLFHYLERMPRIARFPFISLLHRARTGVSLLTEPRVVEEFPKVHAYVLSLLSADDGRTLLDLGTRVRGKDFAQCSPFGRSSLSSRGAAFVELWTTLQRADVAHLCLPVLWEGLPRGGATHEKCERGVATLKETASRNREDRITPVNAAYALCFVGGAVDLFVEIVEWTAKRFAKDPATAWSLFSSITEYGSAMVQGPPGLFASSRTRGTFNPRSLEVYNSGLSGVFASLQHLQRVWLSEPSGGVPGVAINHQQVQSHLQKFLADVILFRFALVEKLYPTLHDDLAALRASLLDPLVELWMSWERVELVEYPEILHDRTQLVPLMLSNDLISVNPRVLPGILPFVDRLAKERAGLYHEFRVALGGKEPVTDYRKRLLDKGQYQRAHPLPFLIEIENSRDLAGISLDGFLSEYHQAVLFGSTTDEADDPLHWHPQQFGLALELYLHFSESKNDVAQKIEKLLEVYTPSDAQEDLRLLVLQNEVVQEYLWTDGRFDSLVRSWLPAHSQNVVQNGEFDAFAVLPPPPPAIEEARHDSGVSRALLRSPKFKSENALDAFLAGMANPRSLRTVSKATAHRLTEFLVGCISTALQVPRDAAVGAVEEQSSSLVSYALRHVRISEETLEALRTGSWVMRETISGARLGLLINVLTPLDVELLLRALFSLPFTPENLPSQMTVFRILRRNTAFEEVVPHALTVFENTDLSSWHRQLVTERFLASLRPPVAEGIISRLLTFSHEKYVVQQQTKALAIKMTTQKMLLQLLLSCMRRGIVDWKVITSLADKGVMGVPTAITANLVECIVECVQVGEEIARVETTSAESRDGAWASVQRYIHVAGSLNESSPDVSDQQWDDAVAGRADMPKVVDQHPVATALLSLDVRGMSPALRAQWAANVVLPILVAHVNNRATYLRKAVAREGGSASLQQAIGNVASYASQSGADAVPYVASITKFAEDLTADSGDMDAVLGVLERRLLSFTSRAAVLKLRGLLEKKYGFDWRSNEYCGTVGRLTEHAVSDGGYSVRIVRNALVLFGFEANCSLKSRLSALLARVGMRLLTPECMLAQYDVDGKCPVPFQPFVDVIDALYVPSKKDQDWESLIQGLQAQFLEEAQKQEGVLSMERYNGGACYWRIIIVLKISLLPNLVRASVTDEEIAEFARELANIAEMISSAGWIHLHFPLAFRDRLAGHAGNRRHFLLADIPRICRALTTPPICPSARQSRLRPLLFETALTIAQTHQRDIEKSVNEMKIMNELLDVWKEDEDGVVRGLALTWQRSPANGEVDDEYGFGIFD